MADPLPKRLYKPGGRNGFKRGQLGNRLSSNRFAWATSFFGQIIAYIYDDQTSQGDEELEGVAEAKMDQMGEPGPTIRLYFKASTGRKFSLPLTGMKLDELEGYKKVINRAIDLAITVVKLRDEVAEDALQRGDTSYARSYRGTPLYIEREESLATYDQSLRRGLEDVLSGDADNRNSIELARRILAELASDQREVEVSEDGQPQAD